MFFIIIAKYIFKLFSHSSSGNDVIIDRVGDVIIDRVAEVIDRVGGVIVDRVGDVIAGLMASYLCHPEIAESYARVIRNKYPSCR